MCLPFTSPHYNRARQQDLRVGVVPESVKLLIGVHYNVTPLLLEPALSLLVTSHLILSVLTVQRAHQGALDRFLCFRKVMFSGITTCLFHPWFISWPSSTITSTAPNVFYPLLATEEIRTPSIITFVDDAA